MGQECVLAVLETSCGGLRRQHLYVARAFNKDVLAISLSEGTLLPGAAADPNAEDTSLAVFSLSGLAADGSYLYVGAAHALRVR